MNREQQIARAFVGLADSVAETVDPTVLFERLAADCVALTGAQAVAVLMAGARGRLRTMAVSDDRPELLKLVQFQAEEGPGAEAWRTGSPLDAPDLTARQERWPGFAPRAVSAGFRAAHALPLRVRRQTVGALTLLVTAAGGLPPDDLALAQAFADVTVVSVVRWHSDGDRPQDVLTQVQSAISSKAAVETAKGMLAAAGDLTVESAARLLRDYCELDRSRPADIAQALIRRTLSPERVIQALRTA
jgi:hypothetical protein